MTRWVAGLAVLAACATEPAEAPPAPSSACREVLTCQVLCERDDCGCAAGRQAVDVEAAAAALTCAAECPGVLHECLTGPCATLTEPCYFAGGPGGASCAATWRCFGDCGDDSACLAACAAATSARSRPLFARVEVCSDRHVALECAEPGPTCDLEALTGPCAGALRACLDDGRAPETEALTAACACPGADGACLETARDALAACPTADADALQARIDCLGSTPCAASCPPWAPSELCQEVLGTRPSPL